MKRISAIFIATALLSGCGGPHYTVTGHYGLTPGDSVYLLGSGDEVLAAGVMDADTTFTLKGRIAAPELASLSDRYATVEPAMLFLEAGTIRIEPRNGLRLPGHGHPGSTTGRTRFTGLARRSTPPSGTKSYRAEIRKRSGLSHRNAMR